MAEARDPELQRLLDRQAIVDVVTRYSRGVDRHDEEILRTVYHPDALDHHGAFTGDPDEFIPWANALHEENTSGHMHFVTNHTIELDGDTAHSETYVFFTLKRKDGSGVDLGGGRYIDRLERRDGEWRIAAREVLIDWTCLAPTVVREDQSLVETFASGTWDKTDASYRRPLIVTRPSA
jgi:hypothetical protein